MTQKVKIGIVGCGVVATAYYLPYLMKMENAEITAVCDLVEARTAACMHLFGAKAAYQDYYAMLEEADLDAVFILTAPGTHVPFTLAAVEAGKHVLLQKPMATTMDDARTIAQAVRSAGVKAIIEPSSNSPLDPDVAHVRDLVRQGVLGDILWFSLGATGPTRYGPALGSNPYGQAAFYAKDSGGFLFDLPYAPANIVSVLGPCKSVMAQTSIAVSEHKIVPEAEYDKFLAQATDPNHANYWDVVVDLPRTQPVRMEAVDNAYSLYELVDGGTGACHIGRIFHPVLPGTGSGALQVFGTEGNLIFGAGYWASIISTRTDLLPAVDAESDSADGWYHIPNRGDASRAKWPQPTPGSFNYYHRSTQHLVDCILEDREPLPNVDWGIHITEMMVGTLESSRTGCKYKMTTTLDY
jgi:predicted dehydrogenase